MSQALYCLLALDSPRKNSKGYLIVVENERGLNDGTKVTRTASLLTEIWSNYVCRKMLLCYCSLISAQPCPFLDL